MQLLLKHRLGGKLDPRWEGLGGHVDEFKRQGGSRWDGFVMQAQGGVRFSGFGKGLREGEAVELGIQMLCRVCCFLLFHDFTYIDSIIDDVVMWTYCRVSHSLEIRANINRLDGD